MIEIILGIGLLILEIFHVGCCGKKKMLKEPIIIEPFEWNNQMNLFKSQSVSNLVDNYSKKYDKFSNVILKNNPCSFT